jgi:hypothetical protein
MERLVAGYARSRRLAMLESSAWACDAGYARLQTANHFKLMIYYRFW